MSEQEHLPTDRRREYARLLRRLATIASEDLNHSQFAANEIDGVVIVIAQGFYSERMRQYVTQRWLGHVEPVPRKITERGDVA